MMQRPELYRAVICAVPLLDMVRYHMFLLARFWVPEYGSADDPEQFEYLLKYSPYQNVKTGTKYPAVMFITRRFGHARGAAAREENDGAAPGRFDFGAAGAAALRHLGRPFRRTAGVQTDRRPDGHAELPDVAAQLFISSSHVTSRLVS